MINVLIADDHPIVRRGLREIIDNESDMQVVAEAKNGFEVFNLVKKTKIDLAMLDISMPDRSGLDVMKQLKKEYPALPVLVLSVHSEEQYALRVLKGGGSGYLTKESAPNELVKAIRKVISGGKYVSSSFAEKLIFEIEKQEKPLHKTLSDREFEVLCKIATGKTVKEIANEMYLSVKTISTYRSRILEKMDMTSSAQLTYYAIKNGLVE